MEISEKLKVLVLGIDGASHIAIRQMVEKGLLPNFQTLQQRSASGILQSTFPPHTAPGWASMFTGAAPGEHGIYQFWSVKEKDYAARGMNVSDYGREPCWVTLERHGYRVGVYNVPMTHPPAPLQGGYMISWPLSKTLRYTSPPELMTELVAAGLHYHSDIVTMYRGQQDYCELAHKFTADRARTCLYLQATRPVDAMFVVFTEVDRVSHYYWGEHDEPAPAVEACYQDMDRALGLLLELTDENTLLVVSSDHGFGACTADFNVHELLAQHGLLTTEYAATTQDAKASHDDATLTSWFDAPTLYKRTIDWDRTQFYMPTPGCFGLNANLKGRETRGALDPVDLPAAEVALRAAVASVLDENGQPWFTLQRGSDVYQGQRQGDAPDYLLMPRDFSIMPTPALTGMLWSPPSQQGVHRPEGILYLAGPGCEAGGALHARIEDVYPTILSHLGLPIPERLDGHWLIQPRAEHAPEPVRQHRGGKRLNVEESAFMDDQLQKIGYF
jgi:predicted AlkP superfamily phosphohydrolase/phosphomutase